MPSASSLVSTIKISSGLLQRIILNFSPMIFLLPPSRLLGGEGFMIIVVPPMGGGFLPLGIFFLPIASSGVRNDRPSHIHGFQKHAVLFFLFFKFYLDHFITSTRVFESLILQSKRQFNRVAEHLFFFKRLAETGNFNFQSRL